MLRRYKCGVCEKSFRHAEELMQHKQVVHGKNSMYECRACNKTFTNGEDLRLHARQYHTYKKK
ncbi:MAG: C2H2-type zinc finger protein [Nitrososphaerales archaeon]